MIELRLSSCVSADELNRNASHARSLGLPKVGAMDRPPLAVLGGGHSIRDLVDEVREFDGDKWIVGSAFGWWRERGIEGKYFSAHPSPAAVANLGGVTEAILSTTSHPSVFEALEGAKVEIFDIVNAGVSSVTVVPWLAISAGYRDITFYGFDSSYEEQSHLYMNYPDRYAVVVECGGERFLTGAEFLKQAEFLAALINAAPKVFKDRSKGLLRAMVRSNGEYEVTHATQDFINTVVFEEKVHV